MIRKDLIQTIQYKKQLLENIQKEEMQINKIALSIYKSINSGGKLMLCGNGGSAADAQHLAAEFLIRLRPNINRKPIAAISLLQDTSTITACGNDYNFKDIFSRNLEALGKKNDILIVISTSGNSANIINVLKKAKKMNIKTIGFLGKSGGLAKKLCNQKILVPSKITARVQEIHIFLGHIIFEIVEDIIIRNEK